MIVERIIRGNLVEFASTFLDDAGEETFPAAVVLTVSFINSAGTRESVTIDMEDDTSGGEFTAVWDSSVAKRGRVHWAVRATDPAGAEEGIFDLAANLANPDP